jgi:CHAD domain-containing protein
MKDSIDRIARTHASLLGKKLAKQVRKAARRQDEKEIHDLRVAIRRFSQCLREFSQFFPRQKRTKTLKRLSRLMNRAAELRNRDIAIQLIGNTEEPLVAALRSEREQARRKMVRILKRWRNRELP